MSRPTNTHRGARLAFDVAREELTQPQLSRDAHSSALEALWASIFDSAEQTLLEERWAAEVHAGGSGCVAVVPHPFPRKSCEVSPLGPNSNTGQKGLPQ